MIDRTVGAVTGQPTVLQRVADSMLTRSNSFCDPQIVVSGLGVNVYVKLYFCKRTHDTGENFSVVQNQQSTFERQSKYNNINNVCLSVTPLVKLFARSKV
uniref:SFRICE_034740 n=1 Tax=Spodoptera frugiperda TaxID=7108 RepID=A0A2H1X0Y2_SPOFR